MTRSESTNSGQQAGNPSHPADDDVAESAAGRRQQRGNHRLSTPSGAAGIGLASTRAPGRIALQPFRRWTSVAPTGRIRRRSSVPLSHPVEAPSPRPCRVVVDEDIDALLVGDQARMWNTTFSTAAAWRTAPHSWPSIRVLRDWQLSAQVHSVRAAIRPSRRRTKFDLAVW